MREPGNLHEVLAYRNDRAFLSLLPMAAALLLLGAFVLLLVGPDKPLWTPFILIAAGVGLSAYALWLRLAPREPDLLLSPDGIGLRLGGRPAILIPWNDVEGVASVGRHRVLVSGLNLCAGMVFGWLYWKKGLEAAFIAHMTAHVVASLAKIATGTSRVKANIRA